MVLEGMDEIIAQKKERKELKEWFEGEKGEHEVNSCSCDIQHGSKVHSSSTFVKQLSNSYYRPDRFTLHTKAVVCQDVELRGDIMVGAGSHHI